MRIARIALLSALVATTAALLVPPASVEARRGSANVAALQVALRGVGLY
jgi:hypothetical protein